MRKDFDCQLQFDGTPISEINFDLRSRDEITKLLIGLQQIFGNLELRDKIFKCLWKMIPENVSPNNGRPGMMLWKIYVLGTLRLICNCDYDKVMELANNHWNLRLIMGHCDMSEGYSLQTIKDNLSLFTEEISSEISKLVVEEGHRLVGKKPEDDLNGSCDSLPVQTSVHFPTDINILWDAMRKMITLIMVLMPASLGLTGWREGVSILYKVKRAFRKVQLMKQSKAADERKKEEKNRLVVCAHKLYLELAEAVILKIERTITSITSTSDVVLHKIVEIQMYIRHAKRQIDQIRRRVENLETIPHHEKVLSIFEEHTEWIAKGKAGVPFEFGLNVCIVKDQFGFILHHRVMQNETDSKIAVPIVMETKNRFPSFSSCSFDKGFHNPENQKRLPELLKKVTLPRKGKPAEIENTDEFKQDRRKHSAVESSLNALENHGLDRCRDHGIEGFKRYVGLAVLARNIQILGHILQQKEFKRRQRANIRQRRQCAALLI